MKYILLIYENEQRWLKATQDEITAVIEAHRTYGEELTQAGVLRGGAELQPTTTATTVRFGGSTPRTMDGPFAETKEHLGGYYVIEVDDLDQAIAWAEKMPGMETGCVEIRPLGMES